MSIWARGNKAWGHCDRCGWRYLLKHLRREKHTKLKVCPPCWEPVPQQSWPPHPAPRDAVALKDPRPDASDLIAMGSLYDDDSDGVTLLKNVDGGTDKGSATPHFMHHGDKT